MSNAPSAWKLEQAMAAFEACRSRLQDMGDDETDLDAVGIAQATEADVRAMLRRVLVASEEAKAFAKACSDRIDSLAVRRDRYKARAENLRSTAFAVMDALGETKVIEPEFTATIGASRLGLIITDESAIPDEYVRITKTPNKSAIKAALEQGEVIEGAELANGMPTLTVRSK